MKIIATPMMWCCAWVGVLCLSSCHLFQKGTNSKNGNGLEPIITHKDTTQRYKPVTKVDTFRWCDTLPVKNNERAVVCYEKHGSVVVHRDTVAKLKVGVNPPVVNKDTQRTNPNNMGKPEMRSYYNVAVLLPFMSTGGRSGENETKSARSVEFYEGMLIAFDSLRKEGVNLNVSVLDTRDNDTLIQTLFAREDLLKADLIIGGVSSDEVRLISNFANQHQKSYISPLNPRELTTDEDCPYLVQISPSYRTHARAIFKYAETMPIRRPKNFIVIVPQSDTAALRQVQAEYAIYKNDANARVKEVIATAGFSMAALRAQCQSGAVNIIIAPTLKESFVYAMLRELHADINLLKGALQENYVVFGLSQWKYFEMVNFEYFEALRLHVTSEFFADTDLPSTIRFKESYFSRYGMPPRDFGYIGFDVMLYAGRMLKKYGTGFRSYLAQEPYEARHTTFKIQPVYRPRKTLDGAGTIKADSIINRYENSYIHILKFEQYKFQSTMP